MSVSHDDDENKVFGIVFRTPSDRHDLSQICCNLVLKYENFFMMLLGLLDMTKKRLVDCVLTNTDEDLQSFDSDETQPPSEDQRNENETQDEVENDLYDDVEVRGVKRHEHTIRRHIRWIQKLYTKKHNFPVENHYVVFASVFKEDK
ncbi:hypothetical protein Scep_030151 [Stephania cephalantha]|uniref:Uncharacterized protein n=1 Tax=Stephania cephalantha TaxID=152367 RepID=A0AAP0DZ04_9MAGN